jgi:hypothetical protein
LKDLAEERANAFRFFAVYDHVNTGNHAIS